MGVDMMGDKFREIAQKQFEELGEPVILFAYMMHLLDLQAQIIKDLATQAPLTPDMQKRLDLLDLVTSESSIDFGNISAPTEDYKIPMAVYIKSEANKLIKRYQNAKIKAGEF